MKDLEEIKMGDLRGAVKALNDTGLLEEKIRVAGVKKEEIVKTFTDVIEQMEEGAELPEAVVDFYNDLYSDEVEKEEPEEAPEKKEKKKATKAPEKKASTRRKGFESFDDLKKFLKDPPNPTRFFDKLTLKGGKIPALIEKLKEEHPEYNTLQTPSSAKAHIKSREGQGYVYEEKADDYIKLVDLKV